MRVGSWIALLGALCVGGMLVLSAGGEESQRADDVAVQRLEFMLGTVRNRKSPRIPTPRSAGDFIRSRCYVGRTRLMGSVTASS